MQQKVKYNDEWQVFYENDKEKEHQKAQDRAIMWSWLVNNTISRSFGYRPIVNGYIWWFKNKKDALMFREMLNK